MIWDLLVWCVFGFIAGGLARFLVPGPDPMGCLPTIALGVVGSVLGGLVGRMLGGGDDFEPAGFVLSVAGAAVVLLLYRKFAKKGNVPPP